MARSETIIYRGIKFRRYPDSNNESHRRYFVPGIHDKQNGVDYLHREIWRDHHDRAEIPDGYHVHHINHDYSDNRPENLMLVDGREHVTYHARLDYQDPEYRRRALDNLDRIRPLTKQWHASDEGREWHSKHWAGSLGKAFVERTGMCEFCGDEYTTSNSHKRDRFCSNKCKAAWRRASGVDDEQRTCAYCGKEFTCNKYSKVKTCSRACGGLIRRGKRTTRLQPHNRGETPVHS